MYGDLPRLEEMKAKLNAVSPSFCMAKWMHTTLHLLNGETHSCYLPPTHKIPLEGLVESPSQLHNTPEKLEQRRQMLAGERPKGCAICWKVEDLPGNQISDRHLRATETWTLPYFDKVSKSPWNQAINPSYVEVSFSSSCNFKCSYCSPHVSSAWEKEIKESGPYQLSATRHQDIRHLPMPIPEEADNSYVEAFWRWLPELYPDLMHLRVTGGEPLLSRHSYRLMDWIKQHPHPELHFSVNSNLGVPPAFLNRFFGELHQIIDRGHVRSFMLHTSLDSYGAHAEYIRHGLKFAEFEKNVHRFLQEFPYASLAFMCTFNLLSVIGFRDFLVWFKNLREQYQNRPGPIHLDLPHLVGPNFLNVRALPEEYQAYIESHLSYMQTHLENRELARAGFRKNEIGKMTRILETMKDRPDSEWLSQARKDFYLFFREHDRRRQTQFLEVFPALKSYWSFCEDLVKYSAEEPQQYPIGSLSAPG